MPNKLDITQPSDREIRITRVFNAPRDLVWDAHTKPELVRRWLLGPPAGRCRCAGSTCASAANTARNGKTRLATRRWAWAAPTTKW